MSEGLVEGRFFEDPINAQLSDLLCALYREYKHMPTTKMIGQELKLSLDRSERPLFLRRLHELRKLEIPEVERKYITTEVRRFVGIQAIKSAISESIEPLKQGDIDTVRDLLRISLTAGNEDALPESSYFEDYQQRTHEDDNNVYIRTLISNLDSYLRGGGLGKRELGIGLAVSNVGKTMFLCHLAKAAVIQRFKVAYFTLDDTVDLITDRLDGSFTGVKLTELRTLRGRVLTRLDRLHRKFKYGNSLIIKEGVPTKTDVPAMDSYLDSLQARGFVPDLVIVDYVNIVAPATSEWVGNRYKELGGVYAELKAWCKERNFALWTAAQANRAAIGKEIATMRELAESFEGIHHSNIVLSLNRTAEERQREQMRLFLAKNKSQVSEIQIPIRTNFSKGAFYRVTK